MGRYFGIANNTKKIAVSGYWKGDGFCDCHALMHRYHWDVTDIIFSSSYDTICHFTYNKTTGQMDLIYEPYDLLESRENNNQVTDQGNEEGEGIIVQFEEMGEMEMVRGHAPLWDGDKCKICGFLFNEEMLIKDREKVDLTYFMA